MPKRSMTVIGVWKKIIFYLGLLSIWELAYKLSADYLKLWQPERFPSPVSTLKTLETLIQDRSLGVAVLTSLARLAVGYGVSLVLGFLIAMIMLRFKFLQDNLSSLFLGLQTLPNVAWVPLALLLFGLSESTIQFVIVIGSVFAIALSIESGVKNVKSIYIKAGQTLGAQGLKTYQNVALPAALPEIIAGMKQGWAFAWRGLISGEMLMQVKGLGDMLIVGKEKADSSQIVAIMLVIIVLGLSVNKLVFERMEANIRYRWGVE